MTSDSEPLKYVFWPFSITELPKYVGREKKSKWTDSIDTPEQMSLLINDLPYLIKYLLVTFKDLSNFYNLRRYGNCNVNEIGGSDIYSAYYFSSYGQGSLFRAYNYGIHVKMILMLGFCTS